LIVDVDTIKLLSVGLPGGLPIPAAAGAGADLIRLAAPVTVAPHSAKGDLAQRHFTKLWASWFCEDREERWEKRWEKVAPLHVVASIHLRSSIASFKVHRPARKKTFSKQGP